MTDEELIAEVLEEVLSGVYRLDPFEEAILAILAAHGPLTGRAVTELIPPGIDAHVHMSHWGRVDEATRLRWTLRSLCGLRDHKFTEVAIAVLPREGWENPASVWRLTDQDHREQITGE